MFLSRWVVAILLLPLLIFTISSLHPATALGFKCLRDSSVAKGVACASSDDGQFATLNLCDEQCNKLCARGFRPACNFTSVCKVYGFAINLLSVGAGLISLAMVLYGAFRFVTGKGVAEEAGKAKSIIVNAGAGLIIVVIAYTLTRVVLAMLQVDTVCF